MIRSHLACCFALLASLCSAQTPTYLSIPVPKDGRTAFALSCAQRARDLGFEGLVVSAGVEQRSDPTKTSWDGERQMAAFAAANHLRVMVRYGLECPAEIYVNGVPQPSWWSIHFNAGKAWPQPFRPPLAVAQAVATYDWKVCDAIYRNAYLLQGLNPDDYLSSEGANEADIGGAGGPWLGSFSWARPTYNKFKLEWGQYLATNDANCYAAAKNDYLTVLPASLWVNGGPEPEGYIDPGLFSILRAAIQTYRPTRLYPLTFEGVYGSVGAEEIASYTGPDAAWISAACDGRGSFNRYMSVPSSSPAACAGNWIKREQWEVAKMRTNPYLTGDLFNMEFGMQNTAGLMTGAFGIADGRQAVLMAQRHLTDIVGGGYFLAAAPDALGIDFNLWNSDLSYVGGLVGPAVGGS